jgi:hypothetical protein
MTKRMTMPLFCSRSRRWTPCGTHVLRRRLLPAMEAKPCSPTAAAAQLVASTARVPRLQRGDQEQIRCFMDGTHRHNRFNQLIWQWRKCLAVMYRAVSALYVTTPMRCCAYCHISTLLTPLCLPLFEGKYDMERNEMPQMVLRWREGNPIPETHRIDRNDSKQRWVLGLAVESGKGGVIAAEHVAPGVP